MRLLQCLIFFLSCILLTFPSYSAGKSTPKAFSAKYKVILLGADGLTNSVIERLLKQNKLKNIRFVRSHGSYGRITSLDPIISPAIWTSIATGKKPKDHGIEHFRIKNDKGRMIVTNRFHRKTKTLWNILSENQMKVGMVGYFTTWPVEKVNGFMISDISVFPIDKGFYPPQIQDVIKEVLEPYIDYDLNHMDEIAPITLIEQLKYFTPRMLTYLDKLGSELTTGYLGLKSNTTYSTNESKQYSEFLKRNKTIYRVIEAYLNDNIKYEYAKRMYKNDIDFFSLFLKGPDIASHKAWRYYEPDQDTPRSEIEAYKNIIPSYYVFVDKVLGYFLRVADQNTIIILVSDHGFKKTLRLLIDINKVLNTMGYLYYDSDRKIKGDKIFDDRIFWGRHIQFRRLHVNLNNIYPNRDPNQDELKMKQIVSQLAAVSVGEFKLFSKINYYPGEHAGLSEKLRNKFYEEADYKPETTSGLYSIEAFINKAFYTFDFMNNSGLNGTIAINQRYYPLKNYFKLINDSEHSLHDGVIHFMGPIIKSGNLIKGLSVLDVTPAILKILDMPVGADMAGITPTGIFKPEYLIEHPTRHIKSYDEINRPLQKTAPQKSPLEHKTAEQLRALGYIQ
jgi:predicted AlkP superfamily phosphohydrolase/phosphomutase